MPNAEYGQIFHWRTISRIIRELQSPSHLFCNTFGCQIGGPAERTVPGREFAWDIFNRTRRIPEGRVPNAGPATTSPQVAGNVYAKMWRTYERTPLDINRLFRNRPMGGGLGTVDPLGQRYAREQMGHKREKLMNGREALLAMMFRGAYGINISGDSYNLTTSTAGPHVVDFQHPASHRGDVGGTFAGNWENTATSQIIQELIELNAHSANNSRFQIRHAFIDAEGAKYVLGSDSVNDYTGTANVVTYDNAPPNFSGPNTNVLNFTIRAYPMITWHVYDDHFIVNDGSENEESTGGATQVPFVEPGKAIFTPDPSTEWLEFVVGSEAVMEHPARNSIREGYGTQMWTEWERHPVTMNLISLENCLPTPLIPTAWYYPDVYTPA